MRLRHVLVPLAAALVAVPLAVAPTAAQTPSDTVLLPVCALDFGVGEPQESVTVQAGEVVLFVNGWGVPRAKGHLVHWLKSQTTTLVLDYEGTDRDTTVDLSDAWTAPQQDDEGSSWFAIATWTIELEPGESVVASFVTSWSKPTPEFSFDDGRLGFSTSPLTGPVCTITALA